MTVLARTTLPTDDRPRPPRGIAPDELADLVRSFTEVTERLQATHVVLESQVRQLTGELAHANEQLRRSRELAALGEMAAGIAHEIRNPLGSIALDVGMLREDVAGDTGSRTLCDRVLRAVERLNFIVGDVLRFARDVRVQVAMVLPSELFDAAIESCEALVTRYGVRVERSCVPMPVAVDRHLMGQALTNLVRNAIEAMATRDSDRILTVSARKSRRAVSGGRRVDHLVMRVEDTGGGVPAEVATRMFHPFFTTRPEGTGLGLAIVHRIVDAHGGSITLQNTDRGARFEIALPMRVDDRMAATTTSDGGSGAVVSRDGLDAAVSRRIATGASHPTNQHMHTHALGPMRRQDDAQVEN